MKPGTYDVKHVEIDGHPKITSVRRLRQLMNDQPTHVIVRTKKNGSPMFLGGDHIDDDKVALTGARPSDATSAVLQHQGFLRKLKLVVS